MYLCIHQTNSNILSHITSNQLKIVTVVYLIYNINEFDLKALKTWSVDHTYLAQTPEIGQGLGRLLSCGDRKQEQT